MSVYYITKENSPLPVIHAFDCEKLRNSYITKYRRMGFFFSLEMALRTLSTDRHILCHCLRVP
ncbi:hypothetical protein M2422_004483 [Enterobacter sp. SLBN-59]|nr:hypothetical protein [Enterobacter sp. SLBN-59]